MSFQISILKVLSSYPDGHSPLEALKSDLNILMTSGQDWADRMKRLAARAPTLDVFTQGLVVRNSNGWQITPEGRSFLRDLETPVAAEPDTAELIGPPMPAALAAEETAASIPPRRPAPTIVASSVTPSKPVAAPSDAAPPPPDRPIPLVGCKDRRNSRRRREGMHHRRVG